MKKLLLVIALLVLAASMATAQPADEFAFTRAIIVNSPPGITSWPITAGITSVRFMPPGGWVVDFDRRLGGNAWPSVVFPGFTGPLQYTLGLCRKLTPSWVCSSVVEFWQMRIEEEGPHSASGPSEISREWFYDGRWGALAGWQPQPGEEVGVYIQACDGRNLAATPPGCTPQRTQGRLVKWGVDVGPPVVVEPPHTEPPHTEPPHTDPDPPHVDPPSGGTAVDFAAILAEIKARDESRQQEEIEREKRIIAAVNQPGWFKDTMKFLGTNRVALMIESVLGTWVTQRLMTGNSQP